MNNQKSYTVKEATKLLENFCSYQERCHKEVEKKLFDLKMIPEAKEKIILHLLQHNYLNEERFAKAFVRGKFSIKNWGKRRIVNELKFKNISGYIVKVALEEINDEDYLNTLHKIAEKKLSIIKENNTFKKRIKLSSFLISKGFEPELVYSVVRKINIR